MSRDSLSSFIFTRSAILWASRRTNRRFEFHKRGQQFIRVHNETLSVVAAIQNVRYHPMNHCRF